MTNRSIITLECPKMDCRYSPDGRMLCMEYLNYDIEKEYKCDVCGTEMVPANEGMNGIYCLGIMPPQR